MAKATISEQVRNALTLAQVQELVRSNNVAMLDGFKKMYDENRKNAKSDDEKKRLSEAFSSQEHTLQMNIRNATENRDSAIGTIFRRAQENFGGNLDAVETFVERVFPAAIPASQK